jgi:hypothetical protein
MNTKSKTRTLRAILYALAISGGTLTLSLVPSEETYEDSIVIYPFSSNAAAKEALDFTREDRKTIGHLSVQVRLLSCALILVGVLGFGILTVEIFFSRKSNRSAGNSP